MPQHGSCSISRPCLGPGQAQGQSPHCATPLAKACQSRGLDSINKGNCVAVPLIGQFWTVAASAQWPVTLGLGWLRGVDLNRRPLGYEPNELPDCSTPQLNDSNRFSQRQTRTASGHVHLWCGGT